MGSTPTAVSGGLPLFICFVGGLFLFYFYFCWIALPLYSCHEAQIVYDLVVN